MAVESIEDLGITIEKLKKFGRESRDFITVLSSFDNKCVQDLINELNGEFKSEKGRKAISRLLLLGAISYGILVD
ncbi:hypothetical protein, partial [Methanobrevibacter filiformis]|uniref:hypothetical protein n=1 Tax=Methanobrevibacter filiformis TaxID=55758 RepID=UPI000B30DC56